MTDGGDLYPFIIESFSDGTNYINLLRICNSSLQWNRQEKTGKLCTSVQEVVTHFILSRDLFKISIKVLFQIVPPPPGINPVLAPIVCIYKLFLQK